MKLFLAILVLGLAGCNRQKPLAQPKAAEPVAPAPNPRLVALSSPVQVIPRSLSLAPGEQARLFARYIDPKEKMFHYRRELFLWEVQEAEGGTLTPEPGSSLYYRYTAPTQEGRYHVVVARIEDPSRHQVVEVVVLPEVRGVSSAPKPLPQGDTAPPKETAPAVRRKGSALPE